MSEPLSAEITAFNGINGATGDYLTPPIGVDELAAFLRPYEKNRRKDPQVRQHEDDLQRKKSGAEDHLGVPPEYGLGDDLSQVGWGMIFPAQADPARVDAVLAAMDGLIQLRRAQVNSEKKFKIFRDGAGYRWVGGIGESKAEFLAHNQVGVGEFRPARVPFYLLIVADPVSIPFEFQYELDVQYAVGRIYFPTLAEYARYAHSVVLSETKQVELKRRAVFFGVSNPGDRPTRLSADNLVRPLYESLKDYSAEEDLDWETELVDEQEAYKANLLSLLGGSQTPAVLLSASHGVGYPAGSPEQAGCQGALVCQDWQGTRSGKIEPRHFLAAGDIPDSACVLGSIFFPFACFGAGTPLRDDFAIAANQPAERLAPKPFLSALPQRLLSHPNGSALAVVGHIDRAWGYSFSWSGLRTQTGSFESFFRALMRGMPVGLAMDRMNLRYAEFATMLVNSLQKTRFDPPGVPTSVESGQLAGEWTATNDARGYAILGDPAVRAAVTRGVAGKEISPAVTLADLPAGTLPEIFSEAAAQSPDGL